jgi:hypothetical protein
MSRSMIGLGALALVGALTFSAVAQDPQQRQAAPGGQEQLRVGSEAPALNLFDLEGQVIVLEFINPTDEKWVELHENKRFGQDGELKQTFDRYKEQGVVWLTICPFSDPAAQGAGAGQAAPGVAQLSHDQVVAALKDVELAAPVLFDKGGKIMKSFGISQLPYVVVVDKQGKIAYVDALRFEGGDLVGSENFDRAIGTAIDASETTTLPAGSPREGQPEQERERLEREGQGGTPR